MRHNNKNASWPSIKFRTTSFLQTQRIQPHSCLLGNALDLLHYFVKRRSSFSIHTVYEDWSHEQNARSYWLSKMYLFSLYKEPPSPLDACYFYLQISTRKYVHCKKGKKITTYFYRLKSWQTHSSKLTLKNSSQNVSILVLSQYAMFIQQRKVTENQS
jgi:hypothetical protein